MKRLTKTVRTEVSFQDRIATLSQPIKDQVVNRQAAISKAVNDICANPDIQNGVGPIAFFAAITGFVAIGCTIGGTYWAILFWVIALGLGFLAYFMNHREMLRVVRAKTSTRERMDHDRLMDPFYERAKLIADAAANFAAHCDRYDAELDLVERELKPENAELMDRYYTQLERSEAVIELAIRNYLNAMERKSRLAAFAQEHPAISNSPESTALSQLVTMLDEPMQIPDLPGITQTSDVLDYEDTLADVARELSEHASSATFEERLSAWQVSNGSSSGSPAHVEPKPSQSGVTQTPRDDVATFDAGEGAITGSKDQVVA